MGNCIRICRAQTASGLGQPITMSTVHPWAGFAAQCIAGYNYHADRPIRRVTGRFSIWRARATRP
jgi:hypothetical protein